MAVCYEFDSDSDTSSSDISAPPPAPSRTTKVLSKQIGLFRRELPATPQSKGKQEDLRNNLGPIQASPGQLFSVTDSEPDCAAISPLPPQWQGIPRLPLSNMRPVPSAEGVSHEFMKGVSHEFMRHKTPDARKSLNPTLEREDFKRNK